MKKRYITQVEIIEYYPLMRRFFGDDVTTQIEAIDGPGMHGAHMIFAPLVEQALKSAAEERLWEAFLIAVSIKRKPKRRKVGRT